MTQPHMSICVSFSLSLSHLFLSNSSLLSFSNIFFLYYFSPSALFPTQHLFFLPNFISHFLLFHLCPSISPLPISIPPLTFFLLASLSLPSFLLPCLPSLLSFSDSTPCSLHVYFWSLSSSHHASITSPWFSLSVSLSSSLLPLSLLRYLLFPNLSHPHVHVCTRASTQTYTCAHSRAHTCTF